MWFGNWHRKQAIGYNKGYTDDFKENTHSYFEASRHTYYNRPRMLKDTRLSLTS